MECKYERLFEELHPPLTKEQAVIEASRCLECGGPYAPAPCLPVRRISIFPSSSRKFVWDIPKRPLARFLSRTFWGAVALASVRSKSCARARACCTRKAGGPFP